MRGEVADVGVINRNLKIELIIWEIPRLPIGFLLIIDIPELQQSVFEPHCEFSSLIWILRHAYNFGARYHLQLPLSKRFVVFDFLVLVLRLIEYNFSIFHNHDMLQVEHGRSNAGQALNSGRVVVSLGKQGILSLSVKYLHDVRLSADH